MQINQLQGDEDRASNEAQCRIELDAGCPGPRFRELTSESAIAARKWVGAGREVCQVVAGGVSGQEQR